MNIFGSFSKLVQIGQAVAALLPVIITAVQSAEAALGAGTGAAKLELVVTTLKTVYAFEQNAVAKWEEIAPAVSSVIEAVVSAFKKITPGA